MEREEQRFNRKIHDEINDDNDDDDDNEQIHAYIFARGLGGGGGCHRRGLTGRCVFRLFLHVEDRYIRE